MITLDYIKKNKNFLEQLFDQEQKKVLHQTLELEAKKEIVINGLELLSIEIKDIMNSIEYLEKRKISKTSIDYIHDKLLKPIQATFSEGQIILAAYESIQTKNLSLLSTYI